MKVQELFEMPQLINKELFIPKRKIPFCSDTTLKHDYTIIEDNENIIAIKHNEASAIIGFRDIQTGDATTGVKIFGSVEFKTRPEIMSTEHLDLGRNILQVDGVEVYGENKKRGLGSSLYLALIAEGYTIISDNTQYLGGQALWKKLAKISSVNNFKVYVSIDGEILLENGKPKVYNGSNINDDELWSLDLSKQYTLFIAKPN